MDCGVILQRRGVGRCPEVRSGNDLAGLFLNVAGDGPGAILDELDPVARNAHPRVGVLRAAVALGDDAPIGNGGIEPDVRDHGPRPDDNWVGHFHAQGRACVDRRGREGAGVEERQRRAVGNAVAVDHHVGDVGVEDAGHSMAPCGKGRTRRPPCAMPML